MLGQGVYGAHSYAKARMFAGEKGTVFCIRIRGDRFRLTNGTDKRGTWRKNGYDCTYCDRPGRRSEMCFKKENITGYSEYTGSFSQEIHRKIDEFFLKSPVLRDATVYIGVAAEIYANSRLGARIGAHSCIAMSCLIDNLTDRSTSVTKEEIEKAFAEATAFGTVAGCAAGTAAFTTASFAVTTTTTEVAAAGWGWLGYTTTVSTTAAGYAFYKLQQRRGVTRTP